MTSIRLVFSLSYYGAIVQLEGAHATTAELFFGNGANNNWVVSTASYHFSCLFLISISLLNGPFGDSLFTD